MRQELRTALEHLAERDRHILVRHFFEDVPMKVIGAELGVTESRISQIVTAAIGKLRQQFGIALLPRKKKSLARPATARAATVDNMVSFAMEVAA